MKTERQLLNKYAEFISTISGATLTFKQKGDINDVNRIFREIVILRRRMMREQLKEKTEDLQMKIKFRKRGSR